MDINDKIIEKESQFNEAEKQMEQLIQFQLTLKGYLQALYEQREAAAKEEVTEGFSDDN